MKKIIHILFFSLIILSTTISSASLSVSKRVIRLAIFDNPQPDPSKNHDSQFINSYLAGVNTAISVAASKGVYITSNVFFHANNLASVIQQASNTKAWKPDVIIGLNTSNDFLMSKAFFGDQVVLSISATDPALISLPPGFYSLGIPDTSAVNAIIKFISKHYSHSNLFITVAAESKESVDFADLLAKTYKQIYTDRHIIEKQFLTDDMNQIDFSKFLSGYEKDDVIVVMSIGYDSAIDLMNKITNHLKPIQPVFVTSTDNWGTNSSPQNMNGYYDAFRVDTLSGRVDEKNYKIFCQNFQKIYHATPQDKISFVTYQTVMSFVDAMIQFPNNVSDNKKSLLKSYLTALREYPNWYRPQNYVIYKLENKKEVYFGKIA